MQPEGDQKALPIPISSEPSFPLDDDLGQCLQGTQEGPFQSGHLVEQNPQAPNVRLVVVGLFADDPWGHGRAHICAERHIMLMSLEGWNVQVEWRNEGQVSLQPQPDCPSQLEYVLRHLAFARGFTYVDLRSCSIPALRNINATPFPIFLYGIV